jgi:hypothetical protein
MRGILEREDSAALKMKIKTLTEKRDEWLSGKFEDAGEPPMDTQSMGSNLGRFFLGGLAERGAPKHK